jgi:hypothetical protein
MGWQVVYVPFLFAGNTIINQNGIFVYNGVPGPGTLKASIAGTAGTDDFGNPYTDNIAAYNQAGNGNNFIQIAVNPTTGIPFLVLEVPNNPTHIQGEPQVNAAAINASAVNEQAQINVSSGFESAPGAAGSSSLQLVSRANDGTVPSSANLVADVSSMKLLDGNLYTIGHLTSVNLSNVLINTTAGNLIHSFPNVAARTYRIHGKLWINAAAAGVAQPFSFQLQGTATAIMRIFTNFSVPEVPAGNINYGKITAFNTDPDQIAGNLANNGALVAEYDGVIIVSAAGTLGVYGRQVTSAADETFNVLTASFTDLIPA